AGVMAALALAGSPVQVAIDRDNNPDALLALLLTCALYAGIRAVQAASLRWLLGCAALVGLAFETKMALALLVAPGIAAAYAWLAPAARATDGAGSGPGGTSPTSATRSASGASATSATSVPNTCMTHTYEGVRRKAAHLAAAAVALLVVGGFWIVAVALTPASQRPWISGTSDNSAL